MAITARAIAIRRIAIAITRCFILAHLSHRVPSGGSLWTLEQVRQAPSALNKVVLGQSRVSLVILLAIATRINKVLCASEAIRTVRASAVRLGYD